jgi:outer membrane protein insertion porin family
MGSFGDVGRGDSAIRGPWPRTAARPVLAVGAIFCLFWSLSCSPLVAQSLPGSPTAPSTNAAEPAHPAVPAPSTGVGAAAASLPPTGPPSATPVQLKDATAGLAGWKGLKVDKLQFEGVTFDQKSALVSELPVKPGQPLDPTQLHAAIQRLFASGLYRDISVQGERHGDSVTLIFVGTPRYYVGRVVIAGVKNERLASLLEYATQLQPGTAFSQAEITAGTEGVRQSLATNGYYQPQIAVKTDIDTVGNQVNATYTVNIGPQARVGGVSLEGTDPGFTVPEFRKKAKLKRGSKGNQDTVSTALTRMRAQYQKRDRLEATTTLQKSTYDQPRKELDYDFHSSEGPIVKVEVEGVKLSKSRIKLLVPIYEEGTIDNDLLNEGRYNIKDFLF